MSRAFMDMSALPRYRRILSGDEKPGFRKAADSGALEGKTRKARRMLKNCVLCVRRCGLTEQMEKRVSAVQGKSRCFLGRISTTGRSPNWFQAGRCSCQDAP